MLYNHLHFHVKVHVNEQDKIEVVGFEVEPLSLTAASLQVHSASAVEHLYRSEQTDP